MRNRRSTAQPHAASKGGPPPPSQTPQRRVVERALLPPPPSHFLLLSPFLFLSVVSFPLPAGESLLPAALQLPLHRLPFHPSVGLSFCTLAAGVVLGTEGHQASRKGSTAPPQDDSPQAVREVRSLDQTRSPRRILPSRSLSNKVGSVLGWHACFCREVENLSDEVASWREMRSLESRRRKNKLSLSCAQNNTSLWSRLTSGGTPHISNR